MNTSISTGVSLKKCEAHLTLSRGRLKNYSGSFYLKDRSDFEIELFNPHDFKVLAKISLNGRPISSSGIILNPGQRVFLERFLDSNEKFNFQTYEVDGSKESLEAIEKNGLVEVSFHHENIPSYWYGNTITYMPSNNPFTYTSPSTVPSIFCSTDTVNFRADSANSHLTNSSTSKSVETGRIEKGEESDQKLERGTGDFSWFASESVSFKILPDSNRPIEVQEIRKYCTECGTRMKKQSWKFCPDCGNKF